MAHETKDLLEKRHLQQNLLTGGANTNPLSDPSQLLDPQQAVQSRIEADLLRRAPMPSGTIPQVAAGPVSGAAVPPATAIGGTGTLPGGTVPVTAPGTTTPQGGLALGGGVGNVIGQLAGDPRFQQVLLQLALRGQPYGGIAATEIAAKEQAAQLERRRVAAMEGQTAAETARVKQETEAGQQEARKERIREILRGGGEVPQELIAQLGTGGLAIHQGLQAEIVREQIAVTLDLDEKLVKVAIERALRGQTLSPELAKALGPESTKYVEEASKKILADESTDRETKRAELGKLYNEAGRIKKDTERITFKLKQDKVLEKFSVQTQQYDQLIDYFIKLGPDAPTPTWAEQANIDEEFITSVREAAKHNENMRHLGVEEQKSKIEYYLMQQKLTHADLIKTMQESKILQAGGPEAQELQATKRAYEWIRTGTPDEKAAGHKHIMSKDRARQGVEPHYSTLVIRAARETYAIRGESAYEKMNPDTVSKEQELLIRWWQLGLSPKHAIDPRTGNFVRSNDSRRVLYMDPEKDVTLSQELKAEAKRLRLGQPRGLIVPPSVGSPSVESQTPAEGPTQETQDNQEGIMYDIEHGIQ
ncbi:helicase ARIP4-like isoform X1 [uncultured Mediterranean phage]|nr:helicase ARIP4-like isoform X1 [uncultured Mediterranean phage]